MATYKKKQQLEPFCVQVTVIQQVNKSINQTKKQSVESFNKEPMVLTIWGDSAKTELKCFCFYNRENIETAINQVMKKFGEVESNFWTPEIFVIRKKWYKILKRTFKEKIIYDNIQW